MKPWRSMQSIWILLTAPCFGDKGEGHGSNLVLTALPRPRSSPLPCVFSECRAPPRSGPSVSPLLAHPAHLHTPGFVAESQLSLWKGVLQLLIWEPRSQPLPVGAAEAVTAGARRGFPSLNPACLWKWLNLNVPSAAASVSETIFELGIFKAVYQWRSWLVDFTPCIYQGFSLRLAVKVIKALPHATGEK